MDPWDRDEADVMMEEPPAEEELWGPPEEELIGYAEAVQTDEPQAPVHEPTFPDAGASVGAHVPVAVLPVVDSSVETPRLSRARQSKTEQGRAGQIDTEHSNASLRLSFMYG